MTENLGNRGLYIGGSDVSALMGKSPFKTKRAVFKEKITGIQEKVFESEAIRFGNRMEETLIQMDSIMENYELVEDNNTIMVDAPIPIKCHLDGVGIKDKEKFVIECKTSSKSFNGVLPEHYMLQVQTYLLYSGMGKARIVFGLRKARKVFGLRTNYCRTTEGFWVERNVLLGLAITDEISKATDIILKGREMLESGEDIEFILDELLGKDKEDAILLIGESSITRAISFFEMAEEAEKNIKEFKEALREKMKEIGVKKATFGNYNVVLTDDSERKSFDEELFEKADSETFAKYKKAKEVFVKTSKIKGSLRITKKGEVKWI